MKRKHGILCRVISILLIFSMVVTPISTKQAAAAELPRKVFEGNGYEITFQAVSSGENTYQGNIIIRNTGTETIKDWRILLPAADEITSIWDAAIEPSDGAGYVIKNAGWNQDIAPESSASFGFSAVCNGTVSPPDSILMLDSEKSDTIPVSDYQGENFAIRFKVVSQWEHTYQAELEITNTSDQPIENWMLSFPMENKITSIWDAVLQSPEPGVCLIQNAGWNQDIAAGQTVSFGFTAEGDSIYYPDSYSIPVREADQAQDQYVVVYQVNSQWADGFTGQLTITNQSEAVLEDWVLDFDFDGTLTEFWTAQLISAEKGHYSIKNAGYNANINPGESLVLGFQGNNPEGKEPSGYRLRTMSYPLPEESEPPESPAEDVIEELYVQKEAFFLGEAAENRIYVRLSPSKTDVDSVCVTLEGSDTPAATLYDNGSLANGDEIKNDRIYSALLPIHPTEAGTYHYLAAVTDQKGKIFTKPFTIQVYDRMTSQDEKELYELNTRTDAFLKQLLDAGQPGLPDIMEQTAEFLCGEEAVSEVRKQDRSLEVVYRYGFSSSIYFEDAEHIRDMSRGGAQTTTEYNAYLKEKYSQYSQDEACTTTGSGRILIWAPFDTEWGDSDEASLVNSVLGGADSEPSAKVDIIRDADADAESLKGLSQYGLVILATHGGDGEWLATGETVGPEPDGQGPLLQTGEKRIVKRVDITGKELKTTYAVTDKWIRSNMDAALLDTIILNNSCESLKTEKLWSAFESRGASAYLGYSKAVTNEFAILNAFQLLNELVNNNNPVCLAYAASCDTHFSPEGSHLLARGQANIKLPFQGENANFSFESDLRGWELEGDVRILSSLGSLAATDGEKMCFVSTGTGYTNALGLFRQKITIPEGAKELSFDWNYMSEEFLEYIGSEYDDPFCVELISQEGEQIPVLTTSVNQIATDFHASKKDGGDLIKVSPEITFDQGDVWMTGWQHESADISHRAGQELTLQFSTQNAWDLVYTTAVLIDNIRIDGKGSQDGEASRIPLDEEDFGDEAILGLVRTAVDPGLVQEIRALNLPWLLEAALISFGGSLAIPGVVLDAACGAGLLIVAGIYWDELSQVWDEIVTIFDKYIAEPVDEAFQYLRDMIEGKGDAGSIEKGLGEIASGYGDFECKEAAMAMAYFLKKKKQEYKAITMKYPYIPGTILSLSREALLGDYQKAIISKNGLHYGIEYKGIVYCNIHPYGLPRKAWEADFWGPDQALRTITP